VLRSLVRDTTLALVRRFLADPSPEDRRDFTQALLQVGLAGDRDEFLDVLERMLADAALTPEQIERLFREACTRLARREISARAIENFETISGGVLHYSQEGEDIILERLLADRAGGFFVDVGAHHAQRFSNTYALYRKGWRGINIDATPGSMASFVALRPEDVNLELAISDRTQMLELSVFKEPALNTFDAQLARAYMAAGSERTGTVQLQAKTLEQVLDTHLPKGRRIDLLSVDVEGEDLAVLQSNNWEKYRPDWVVIEALDTPFSAVAAQPAVAFLIEIGFEPIAKLFNSVVLRKSDKACAAS